MRVHANGPKGRVVDLDGLRGEFERDVGGKMGMEFEIHDEGRKGKVMLMVSKIGRECAIRGRGEPTPSPRTLLADTLSLSLRPHPAQTASTTSSIATQ